MDLFFATGALIVSLISLLITIWLWRESNRPVVTARIKTHNGGNIAILYNLEVVNSGSRPARNVRLSIKQSDLNQALVSSDKRGQGFEGHLRLVNRCFEGRAAIPILLNSETCSNAFGHTSKEDPFWLPGALLPISISYQGIEGQSYKADVCIKIDDTAGFAGSFYGRPEDD
ncbi:hypothetical protein [Xanthomonas citri]|uniref:hypothetical protein n=1 Tax=Xanthomonas citri TaxID=346 RepID=UPI00103D582D|nr:hypothetical protein [Xanthomonas citri]